MEKNKYEIFYKSITKMTNHITASLKSKEILDYIIKETVDILPNTDGGVLFLYDERKQKLIPKSTSGYNEQLLDGNAHNLDEGVSGYVFKKGESTIFNDQDEIELLMNTLQPHNRDKYDLLNKFDYFPKSMLVTPLKYKDKVIGIITLDVFSTDNRFENDDKELLESVADLVAITIIQSQSIKREKQYLKELEDTNNELKRERFLLKKTIEIHNSLNNIALKNKGFKEIMDFLSKIIPYPTALYNVFFERIVATENCHSRLLPSNIYKNKDFKKGGKKIKIVDSHEALFFYSITSAHKLLGMIVVWLPIGEKIDEISNIYLNYCSNIFAMEFNKVFAVFEANQKSADAFYKNILAQNYDDNLIQQSQEFGLDIDNNFVVSILKIDSTVEYSYFSKSSIIDKITATANYENINSLVIFENNNIVVIASYNGHEKDLNKKISRSSEKLLKIEHCSMIGVGGVHNSFYNIRNSYYEALRCVNVFNNYNLHQKIINYNDLGTIAILLNQNKKEVFAVLKKILMPLLEYDKKKSSNLMDTLLYYCEYNKAIHKVAKIVYAHPNTVYNRIKKAEMLLDLDLNNHQDWINIQNACLLFQLLKPGIEELKES